MQYIGRVLAFLLTAIAASEAYHGYGRMRTLVRMRSPRYSPGLLLALSTVVLSQDADDSIGEAVDAEGVAWTEYHDDATGRSYFHDPTTGRTQWTITQTTIEDRPAAALQPETQTQAQESNSVGEDPAKASSSSPSNGKESDGVVESAFGASSPSSGSSPSRPDGGERANSRSKDAPKKRSKKRQRSGHAQQSRSGGGGGRARRSEKSAEKQSPPPAFPGAAYLSDPSTQLADPYDGAAGYGYYTLPAGPGHLGGGALLVDGDYGDYYAAYGMVGPDGQLLGPAEMAAFGGLAYMDAGAFEAMGGTLAQPPDADSLHLLQDPAGVLSLEEAVVTPFDGLQGVVARSEFNYPLKSPLVFHEMFLRSPDVSSGVEEVRASLEERLAEDDSDFESWEQLGHVWRHYGNVPRTMDCYRKALSLLPPDAHAVRSSLHINLAGLLDQMKFVEDALVVLHAFLDAGDVTTYEAENNFAVGYMMVAQLELRAKRFDGAEAALAASLQLQPRLRPAVVGVQKELKHWKKRAGGSGGGDAPWSVGPASSPSPPPSLSPSSPGLVGPKDPWCVVRVCSYLLRLVDHAEFLGLYALDRLAGVPLGPLRLGALLAGRAARFAKQAPRAVLLLRKLANAVPCVVAGCTSRAIAEHGWLAYATLELAAAAAATHPRAGNRRGNHHHHHHHHTPHDGKATLVGECYLLVPLLVGHGYSMLSDFAVVDCLVLLFVGGLLFPFIAPNSGHSKPTLLSFGPLALRVDSA